MKRRLLTLLLALCLTVGVTPALAAGEEAPQAEPLPGWATVVLADGYALGLFGDEIALTHGDTVTLEQVEAMAGLVADKLALLGMPQRLPAAEGLVIDTTRGGVVNALYQAAASYQFPGIAQEPADYLVDVGALCGDGTGLHLDRPCTVLEAATMANALVLSLYDQQNAGSLGLLWKATGGENTLYLLGSIHTDRNNVYPFHRQLRDIILTADQVAFELDFNDQEGILEFAAMQVYTDGTTLADHVDPGLYQLVVALSEQVLGIPEELVALYKPWALASTFQSLATTDETSGANAMAIDLYINAKAANAGIPIEGVETYALQGGIFDGLSPEYQELYLASSLLMISDVDTMPDEVRQVFVDLLGEEALEPAAQDYIQAQLDQIGAMMDTWKARDAEGFDRVYGKDAILTSDDELNAKLFTDRDPGMIAYAADYLSQEGSHTGLMVVGAGHMVGDTGIVQGLKDLGYTVEVVPSP